MSQALEPLGWFGGTFDPVHFGHLRVALEARRLLSLDQLHLMPAGTPPHRAETFAEAGHRLAMLRLATASFSGFTVDDREVRRSGYSYMVDTLAEIRAEQPRRPILLLIGQDAANGLDRWHRWRTLFDLAHLVILRRPGSRSAGSAALRKVLNERQVNSRKAMTQSAAGRVLTLDVTQLAISSTEIRAELARGVSPRYLLPDCVLDYITEHRLYAIGS